MLTELVPPRLLGLRSGDDLPTPNLLPVRFRGSVVARFLTPDFSGVPSLVADEGKVEDNAVPRDPEPPNAGNDLLREWEVDVVDLLPKSTDAKSCDEDRRFSPTLVRFGHRIAMMDA